MVNKIIQAVAGAGKTHYVTNKFDENMKIVYITYTNGNVKNILNELHNNAHACNYVVTTFSKFISDWCIRPFFPILSPVLGKFGGYTTVKPPENERNKHNGYIKKDYKGHYVDKYGRLFLSRTSQLVVSQDKKTIDMFFSRMGKYIDLIVVDEYQDFTGDDFKFLNKLIKQKRVNVIFTGDIFQTGVSQSNKRKSSKLLEYEENDTVENFLKTTFKSKSISIDSTSLSKSRRISPQCASFVSDRIGIPIESEGLVNSAVIVIQSLEELKSKVSSSLTVLIFNQNIKKQIPNASYQTWSYVKGNTIRGDVLIVLTDSTNVITKRKITNNVSNRTKNMLYVALTRAMGTVYIVSSDIWKKLQS